MSLRLTLIQSALYWEDIDGNLKTFHKKIKECPETDIIMLPEMFTTGFTMNVTEVAEAMNGKAVRWMHQMAKEKNAVITGSLIISEGGNYYNRLLWVQPDGKELVYDKKHLFSMANEHLSFTAGTEKLIIDYKNWKIAPFICYDLRFPVWNRNQEGYDLAFYVANWPAKRSFHWNSLLLARAIENQAYVVAVNRVGTDGKGFEYSGDSSVIDPAGEILYHKKDLEDVFTLTITKENLAEKRKQFPFWNDKDAFEIVTHS